MIQSPAICKMRSALMTTRGNIISIKSCVGSGVIAYDEWLKVVDAALHAFAREQLNPLQDLHRKEVDNFLVAAFRTLEKINEMPELPEGAQQTVNNESNQAKGNS